MNLEFFPQTTIPTGAHGWDIYCWFQSLLQLTDLLIAAEIPALYKPHMYAHMYPYMHVGTMARSRRNIITEIT